MYRIIYREGMGKQESSCTISGFGCDPRRIIRALKADGAKVVRVYYAPDEPQWKQADGFIPNNEWKNWQED